MFKKNSKSVISAALGFLALLLVGMMYTTSEPLHVNAAQLAAPTPVVVNNPAKTARAVEWMNKKPIRANTRVCKDLRDYNVSDIQWVVDEGVANSMTLKIQYTIDGLNFVDGATLVASTNTADVAGLNQYPLFGLSTCAYIRVTNANTITLTFLGIAK